MAHTAAASRLLEATPDHVPMCRDKLALSSGMSIQHCIHLVLCCVVGASELRFVGHSRTIRLSLSGPG